MAVKNKPKERVRNEQYRTDPEHVFPGSGHMKPVEEELAKAKRRVRELEEEVEILKKAAAYDVYYNCRRLHSALGYKSPLFYELSSYHPFRLSA